MSQTAGRPLWHRLEEGLLVLLVGGLLLLAFGQILLRNLFNVTWLWADPLVRYLVLWTSFLGALIATRQDRHIRVDAALRLLPGRWRHVAAAAGNAAATALCLGLTPIAVRYVLDERQYGGDAFLDIPRWVLQLIFPVAFGGMGLRFLVRFVVDVRHALTEGR